MFVIFIKKGASYSSIANTSAPHIFLCSKAMHFVIQSQPFQIGKIHDEAHL